MTILNLEQIKEILPHREPFLFVDEVLEFESEKKAVGVKTLLEDDFYFKGHFPNQPIMPGVLLTEAMAQVGCIIIMQMPQFKDKLALLTGLDNVKFRNSVYPNDKLIITAELIYILKNNKLGKVSAKIECENKLIAEANIIFSFVNKE